MTLPRRLLALSLLAALLPIAGGCLLEQQLGEPSSDTEDANSSTEATDSESVSEGTESGDSEESETSVGAAGTLFEYLEAACPWSSRCTGESLDSCLGAMSDDDSASFSENIRALGLSERTDCVLAATSCDDWEACSPDDSAPVWGGFEGDVDAFTCPGDVESVCLEQSDTFLFCLGGEEVALVRELSLDGMACVDGRAADDPPQQCQADACDGAMIRACADGLVVSADCSFVHPDFECEDFNFGCAVPTPECETNNFNNSGGSAQCQDDDIALICMGGKSFTVSCAAVGGRCENDGDLDARCV